ncbi:C40 family peptidase [Nocardioides scoriae]|uniref:C40 family peptidase n=1 Tax=Nocardioides scoriae TaxID=642780 RepID=UPI000B81133F|nr:C40 family peptidase [Nocardioides scoriae]
MPAAAPHARPAALRSLTVVLATLAVVGTGVLGPSYAAPHRPDDTPAVPSAADVARADRAVASGRTQVAQIQSALLAASARLEQANVAAESAAEAYNGARWALSQAQDDARRAARAQREAKADVAAQRSGIVSLVTESYQNGTELDTATALLTDEGPRGVMNRYSVVQSAGESMDARYQDFRVASKRAAAATAEADAAEQRQEELSEEARRLAAGAGQAAADAAAQAGSIAAEQRSLVAQLARAQHVSVALATRRHAALEERAREKAAAARRAAAHAAAQEQAQAEQAARARARAAAQQAAEESAQAAAAAQQSSPAPAPAPAPKPAPAPAPAPNGSAVQRAIAYAAAQVGKPYLWGADGPDSFDCSGLTQQAWARGGISLPHYSVAQYYAGTPIPMSSARAGDLIFWSDNGAPSGIHHVALYLGGGRMLEAPRTGLDVRYNTIYSWYPDFAVRL